ncbi:MAG: hypothetical protein QG553_927 [Patescibacteria group bacterium]|nr:hypothetical protein [Patescibacteria group bacterium]
MSVIDDYLKTVNPDQFDALERVRKIIVAATPDAEETIGYGMPVIKYKGKYVMGFCGFKDHMSLFPGSEGIAELKDKLKGFKVAKGTIQFTVDNPVPEELIIDLVKMRLQDITSK